MIHLHVEGNIYAIPFNESLYVKKVHHFVSLTFALEHKGLKYKITQVCISGFCDQVLKDCHYFAYVTT